MKRTTDEKIIAKLRRQLWQNVHGIIGDEWLTYLSKKHSSPFQRFAQTELWTRMLMLSGKHKKT